MDKTTRQLVAEEAARLIYEEGYRDYRLAKNKAAERLCASTQAKSQPTNEEVETALRAYISLFAEEEQLPILREHREIALEAMGFLSEFKPRLTGPALDGTSGPYSAVILFLQANRAEDVIIFLEEQNIPFQIHERKVKLGKHQDYVPLLRFYADEVEVELMIFPESSGYHGTPVSSITGKTAKYADADTVRELLSNS